jgi:acetyl-CoA acyltransferase
MTPTRVVIAGFVRTPFTFAHKGALVGERPDDLAAVVIAALVANTGIDPDTVEDVSVGCAFPEGEQGYNVARIAALLAGLPRSVAAQTVNRFCGSSMQTIHSACGAIMMGAGDAHICAGVESMTRVPMGGFSMSPNATLVERYPAAYMAMGETAENVAARYQVGRERQEAFALASHTKAAAARRDGTLAVEITPVGTVSEDGCIRPTTSLEALAAMKPAFRDDGTVTAATSSPLTDGACAVLVCSDAYADRHGLKPLAYIRSFAVAGCDADVMGIGPVNATRKALRRAAIGIRDVGVVELNEAFASQALACIDQLGIDPDTVNIDGGAIALGHPLGATGARITAKAAALLRRTGERYAVATQCIGGGQGITTILESAA